MTKPSAFAGPVRWSANKLSGRPAHCGANRPGRPEAAGSEAAATSLDRQRAQVRVVRHGGVVDEAPDVGAPDEEEPDVGQGDVGHLLGQLLVQVAPGSGLPGEVSHPERV